MSTSTLRKALVAMVCVAAAASTAAAAHSSPVQLPSVVSANPAGFTPRVTTGEAVYTMLKVGPTMYAGGDFTQVQNSARTRTYPRTNLVAFGATTGVVTSLSVSFDAPVWALASDRTSLYVGGKFTSVNGSAARGIVKLDPATGKVDPAFDAALPSGAVTGAQVVGRRLIISGTFPKRLAALDLSTGRDTGYLDLGITGKVAPNAGPTKVFRFAVNPAGTRLVGVGNFTTVAGKRRYRAFMLDLGATASLDPWRYLYLRHPCAAQSIPSYLQDVDFDPTGRYFVLAATGFYAPHLGLDVCDGAARFQTSIKRPDAPRWINYTGGDTLHSVAVTTSAVYVQGHQRWLDNAGGRNDCAPGCKPRPGIGAIDPDTGKALGWNPTKDKGVGGYDLLITRAGLWVASDTTHIGKELHERIALMPAR